MSFYFVLSKTWSHLLFSQTLLKKQTEEVEKSAADSHFILCWTEHIVNTSAVTSQLASLPTPHSDVCMGPNQAPPRQHNFNFTFLSAANRSEPPSFWTFVWVFFDSPVNFLPTAPLSLPLAYSTRRSWQLCLVWKRVITSPLGRNSDALSEFNEFIHLYLLGEKKKNRHTGTKFGKVWKELGFPLLSSPVFSKCLYKDVHHMMPWYIFSSSEVGQQNTF